RLLNNASCTTYIELNARNESFQNLRKLGSMNDIASHTLRSKGEGQKLAKLWWSLASPIFQLILVKQDFASAVSTCCRKNASQNSGEGFSNYETDIIAKMAAKLPLTIPPVSISNRT
ncbi:MAG: hypothetical protein K2X81_08775, partial [Candidatus Obscuribacterales bacterium]|nr:hypothetical protein [Candidatus Obscuribacterales bacterium]